MKHQISKVALIATFAFIGVGFAGTQQAKATGCPNVNCNVCDANQTARYADCNAILPSGATPYKCTKTIKSSYVHCDSTGKAQPVCVNCDGQCPGNRYIVEADTYTMDCPQCFFYGPAGEQEQDTGSVSPCQEIVPQFNKGAYGNCDPNVAIASG